MSCRLSNKVSASIPASIRHPGMKLETRAIPRTHNGLERAASRLAQHSKQRRRRGWKGGGTHPDQAKQYRRKQHLSETPSASEGGVPVAHLQPRQKQHREGGAVVFNPRSEARSENDGPALPARTSKEAQPRYTTMLTKRPFTTITLQGSLPSRARSTASKAAAFTASSEASASTVTRPFTLPFTCTASSTESDFA